MKHLLKIIFMLIVVSSQAFSQSSNDTTGDKKAKEIEKKSDFIDENANGVDDRIEQQQSFSKKKRMRDKFIDLDGDGICDSRQGGVGIRSRHGDKQGSGQKRLGHR